MNADTLILIQQADGSVVPAYTIAAQDGQIVAFRLTVGNDIITAPEADCVPVEVALHAVELLAALLKEMPATPPAPLTAPVP